MQKFHVNKATGRVGICRASKRGCPLGEDTPHFTTREAAKDYIEKQERKKSNQFSTFSKNSRNKAKKSASSNKKPIVTREVSTELDEEDIKKLHSLGLTEPENYEDFRRNCEKILDKRMPKWSTDMKKLMKAALSIPQSPEEVNSEVFQERTDRKILKKFGKTKAVGLGAQSHSRAANGFYTVGNEEKGYIVYSNLNEIVGESKTLRGALKYLKFEHRGEMRVYRFEDDEGSSPFNSKNFEEKFEDSYENFAMKKDIYCPNPKFEDLGVVFIQDFRKFKGNDAIFGCLYSAGVERWFPKDKIDFGESFKIKSYSVPSKDVVVGRDQVLYSIGNAKQIK